MPLAVAYMVIRFVLSLVAVLVRGDVSKDVELLLLRPRRRPADTSADAPACPARAVRTHRRSVSRLTPTPLATDAYVRAGSDRYNATASALNSGEYTLMPTKDSLIYRST
jgi:hypothetical protein